MRTLTFILAAVAIGIMAAVATAASPPVFSVSVRLTDGERTFATPSVVVRANEPARVEVSGVDRYALTLTVSDVAVDEIQVVADLDSARGSMTPTVVVRPGEAARVSVGKLGFELTVDRRAD